MCDAMYKDLLISKSISIGCTIGITVVNFILALITQTIAESVGYNDVSEKYTAIMVCTFVSSYINTAMIPVLTFADLRFAPDLIAWIPLRQNFTDFTTDWYIKVGHQLVSIVILQGFIPWISTAVSLIMYFISKTMDKCNAKHEDKHTTDPYNYTSQTNPFDYFDLYAGPRYNLHNTYAKMLLVVYISFTYAIILPMMIPLCCFTLFSIYVIEILMLTYWYRRPPPYDAKLYNRAIELLKFVPIPMFAIGYWGLSNVQMFHDTPMIKQFSNLDGRPLHWILPRFTGITDLNQAHFVLFLLMFWFGRITFAKLEYILFPPEEDEDDMEENIPHYWHAINGRDQKDWFVQADYERKQLGIKKISAKAFKRLQTTKRLEKVMGSDDQLKKMYKASDPTIVSMVNYDITLNSFYQNKLRFMTVYQRDPPAPFTDLWKRGMRMCEDSQWIDNDLITRYLCVAQEIEAMIEVEDGEVRCPDIDNLTVIKLTGKNRLYDQINQPKNANSSGDINTSLLES